MPLNIDNTFYNSTAKPFLLQNFDLRGGFRVCADIPERDSYAVASWLNGCIVYCVAEATFYQMEDRTTLTWKLLDMTGTINLGDGLTLTDGAIAFDPATSSSLSTLLDDKAASVHGHAIADVTNLQTELDNLNTAVGTKAASVHSHGIADVTGLQTALDSKSDTSHLHTIESLSNVTVTSIATDEVLRWNGTAWVNATLAEAGLAPTVHTHGIADVTGLQTSLDSKSDTGHGHAIADVTNLQPTLDTINTTINGKADASHFHTIAAVTGLQTELENLNTGKANISHSHGIAEVTDLQTELDSLTTAIGTKADSSHTQAISTVVGLQTELDTINTSLGTKASSVHTHGIADVTGLQTALDNKASASHTHDASDTTSGVFAPARIPQVSTLNGVTISASDPTGGVDGDIWFKVV